MPVRDGSIRYFTNSELQTFKRCRRKWWFAYWLKITPIREELTGVRGLGTRLHAALRVCYRPGGTTEAALLALEEGIAEDAAKLAAIGAHSDDVIALEKDAELARIMLTGYFEWAAEEGIDVGLTIIADEAEVDAPFPMLTNAAPIHLLGRLDVRVKRDWDDARMFIDHKSVGSFAQATANLHMNEQMQMYQLLEILEQTARGVPFAEAERCDGGIYNMMRRVKRTARAKPPFYAREEVRHNVTELRSFYARVHYTIREILSLEERLWQTPPDEQSRVAYPTPAHDCTYSCDFYNVCPMHDDGSRADEFTQVYFKNYDPLDRYDAADRGTLSDGETE